MKRFISLLLAALSLGLAACSGSNDQEAIDAIFARADARRASIINSETSITKGDSFLQGQTYTGTAYYVANSGSDQNSGLSPESPWQSLDKVNSAALKEGDAVFFNRGDLWYGQLWGLPGVSYSAYGQGPKPLFSGSLPDIAQPSNWTLYKDQDGKKIWQYAQELGDISGIFFDSYSQYATKLLPAWDGKNYVRSDGRPFELVSAMQEDLSFFSALNVQGQSKDFRVEDSSFTGPLYLRCDAGNPGEIFDDIQFNMGFCGFSPYLYHGKGITVDNLAFTCYSGPAVSCAGYQGWTDTIIQNCEISYSGGLLQAYAFSYDFAQGRPTVSGGVVHFSGSNNKAINNYIHHCDSKVFVLAIHDRGDDIPTCYQNLLISGNLVEYCGTSLYMQDCLKGDGSDKTGGYKDILFEDNYVLHTGLGWVQHKLDATDPYDTGGNRSGLCISAPDAFLENVQISNNILWGATKCLIYVETKPEYYPSLSNNTYAQNATGLLHGYWAEQSLFSIGAASALEKHFGETQPTLYTIR